MPAELAGLEDALEQLAASPSSSAATAAQGFAAALQAYAAAVVPASSAVAGATPALASALTVAFGQLSSADAMEAALTAWSATVGLGMAPAFVAVPPPAPVGLAALFAGTNPATHAAAAARLGGAIDTWFRTGTGTPAAGGAPVPWS